MHFLAVPLPVVRLLPYSLVLGMVLTSPFFLKVVSTVEKQQNLSTISSSAVSKNGKSFYLSFTILYL